MSPCKRASPMARTIAGRSTVFSRCSSALSALAPAVVIGCFFIPCSLWFVSSQPLMQRLRRIGYQFAQTLHADRRGTRPGDGRVGWNLSVQRRTADDVAVLDGAALFLDRIDHQRDLGVH